MSEKYQWFNELKFTRDDKSGYYLNSTIRKRMHRYVWEFYNESIPNGYSIHHIDHDRSNNDINNLKLIVTKKHATLHGLERAETSYDEMIKNLDENARPKANEWHASKEGRLWHKKHYEDMKCFLYAEIEYMCQFCGKNFMSIDNGHNKFCSNKCKSAWRRKAGVDNETRTCQYCGKEFTTNKYSNTKCCSKSCSNSLLPRLPQLRKNKKD